MINIKYIIIINILLCSCHHRTIEEHTLVGTDSTINKWQNYYVNIFDISDKAKNYIDILEKRYERHNLTTKNDNTNSVVYTNSRSFSIPSDLLFQEEKHQLITKITDIDSTAFVRIEIPFNDFNYKITSDYKLGATLTISLEDSEWTNIYESVVSKMDRLEHKSSNIIINTEYIIFEQNDLNFELSDIKPQWLKYKNSDGQIRGTIIFYREEVPDKEEDIEISVWLPHRNFKK